MKDVVVDMRKVFYNHSVSNGHEKGWETRIPDGIIIMTGSDINSEIPWDFGSKVGSIPLHHREQDAVLITIKYVSYPIFLGLLRTSKGIFVQISIRS